MSAITCPNHVGKSCPKNCFSDNQKKIIHRIYILHPLISNSTNVHFPFWKNPILFLVCLPSSKKYMVPLWNGLKLILKGVFFVSTCTCIFTQYLFSSHTKGQIISKCPFGVLKSPKKTNEIFSRISALASKKRSNQKRALYTANWRILF